MIRQSYMKAPSVEGLSPSFREGVEHSSLSLEDSGSTSVSGACVVPLDGDAHVHAVGGDDRTAHIEDVSLRVERSELVELHLDFVCFDLATYYSVEGEHRRLAWL